MGNVFKIIYQKTNLFGGKVHEVILREQQAIKFIRKCNELNCRILNIEHA